METANGRIDLTICICTRDRAKELARTLERIASLKIPEDLRWEFLLVDNNSSDDTREVAQSFAGRLPLEVIVEKEAGVSNARNCAIDRYRGDVLYFLDDDVDVEPDWLERTWADIAKNPDFGIYGGKVVPRWDVTPPKWFSENYGRLHSNPHVDLGPENVIFAHPKVPKLIGANLGFRRTAFEGGHLFRPDLGQRGRSKGVGGEEIEIQERMMREGHRGLYLADSVTYHRDAPSRMTLKYVLRWYYLRGQAEVRTGEFESSLRQFLGIPYYLYRGLMLELANSLRRLVVPTKTAWVLSFAQVSRILGAMSEFLSRQHSKGVLANPDLR